MLKKVVPGGDTFMNLGLQMVSYNAFYFILMYHFVTILKLNSFYTCFAICRQINKYIMKSIMVSVTGIDSVHSNNVLNHIG